MDNLLAVSLLNSVLTILAGAAIYEFAPPRSRTMRFLSGWLLGTGALMLIATLYITWRAL